MAKEIGTELKALIVKAWIPENVQAIVLEKDIFEPLDFALSGGIEKEIFESKEVKKVLEKEELKPLEQKAKGVLKGILGD